MKDQDDEAQTLLLRNLQLTLSARLLLDIRSPNGNILYGYLGWLLPRQNSTYVLCDGYSSGKNICLQYNNGMKLSIKSEQKEQCEIDNFPCESVSCYTIKWDSHSNGAMDCFVLGDDFWYGGGEQRWQRWPLQNDTRPWHAFVTGDPLHHPTGGVIENLWLSSGGFAIFVNHEVPLFVSFNESGNGKLCFSTSTAKHPFLKQEDDNFRPTQMTYSICSAPTIKDAYIIGSEKWLKKPTSVPDEMMFQGPIWSTWVRYKDKIDHVTLIEYARGINEKGFSESQMEIDDKWENCYGNMEFDKNKFPKPGELVKNLKYLGFRVTLWVHPFCNFECETFADGKKKGYWVKQGGGEPAEVKWWNGIGAMLDVTNKEAVKWFLRKLRKLSNQYGIDSFKFDAGEVSWLPPNFILHDKNARMQPNLYSELYVQMASEMGIMVEVRVGRNTQDLPVFVRMFDKFSDWSYDNGIKTLIPTALHFSLMGYPFFIPDMVGGNNYESNSLPDKELYIRWLQVNAFLPVIQMSIAPWDYDEKVTEIAKKLFKLHFKYSFFMLSLASQAVNSHKPIIRPLWWISPDDPFSLRTDDEFLVGDGILVAPVLEKNKEERDIYLPEGRWMDMLRDEIIEGPQWLYGYKVLLEELPYFVLQQQTEQYGK